METTISTICNAIDVSPLKYIKGECRLLHLKPADWADCLKDEYFFVNYPLRTRTLSFGLGGQFLGKLVVEKRDLSVALMDDNGNLFMTLEIEKNGLFLIINIYCESKFPGLGEFAEFVAYTTTQILV